MIKFRELNFEDEYMLNNYKQTFLKLNEDIHGASGLSLTDTRVWIENLEKFKSKSTTPKNFVPAHTFILTDEENILGIINLRHELNDYLYNYGGHIGYSVHPDFRKLGYAKKMLNLCINFAFNELNLNSLLLTCDTENIASKKTIISCGGILENIIEEKDRFTARFYIHKK